MENVQRLQAVEDRAKSNTRRIDKLEERQDNLEELTKAFSIIQNEQEHIKDDVGEIKADVKTLTEKPIKRWESIVDKALFTIVGAVVSFILLGVGM